MKSVPPRGWVIIKGWTGRNACPTENMQTLLATMIGKKVDVYCGGASSLRGEVIKVEEGVVHLKDSDGKICYVAVDKIMVVWEARGRSQGWIRWITHLASKAGERSALPDGQKTKTPALNQAPAFCIKTKINSA